MSEKPKKLVVDLEKGTEEYIELTDAEIQERELQAIELATRKAELEAEEKRVADLRASAKAKLTAGEPLTDEEAAVLTI